MSKLQTRRTISLSAPTYVRLRRYAKARGRSMCAIVDLLVNGYLTKAGAPKVARGDALEDLPAVHRRVRGSVPPQHMEFGP